MQHKSPLARPAILMTAAWLILSPSSVHLLTAQQPSGQADRARPVTEQASRPILPPGKEAAGSSDPAPLGESTRQAVVRVAASMAIVLAIFFLVIWFLRRSLPRQVRALPAEAFEVLGTATLSSRHTLQLLKIGSRLLLVSLAASGATSLIEIRDEVEVERLLSLCEAGRKGKRDRAGEVHRKDSFQQVLSEMGIDRSETTGTRQAS